MTIITGVGSFGASREGGEGRRAGDAAEEREADAFDVAADSERSGRVSCPSNSRHSLEMATTARRRSAADAISEASSASRLDVDARA